MNGTSIIVIGGLNTDIIANGVKRFPAAGEHVYGKELVIGPGGKSRNIAAMAGKLLPGNRVAMIGRTAKDKYGLWQPPVDALHAAGVNTDFVNVLSEQETEKLPAIALIPVNEQGENQIIVLPGISDDFDKGDIDSAQPLFDAVSKNEGFLALTLECPVETAKYAIEKAVKLGIKVLLDPGGIEPDTPIKEFLSQGIYLFKPNEHEAKMITGIEVTDFTSARQAANKLKELNARNVLITHGELGAYLFTESSELHIPIPEIADGSEKDSTGCGDQTMAALCAYLDSGKTLEEAAKIAVLAGTLQFHKSGIQPISAEEIKSQL